ncbi:MAG: Crp/Fnr family transcriptional regulator [Curvibacter lanceolatus]|jgi:CRP-like cAMP-binding protein|uniref:Crp/Fnr family transcriptional regulator n=1 Tax=Curvibacter lanceolatus TaxID=86182 RepID=UPI00039B45D6|nr:Crp/Fnr family transcriptional regulator [Curvibacter lanceolatus]MBV5293316.1 Crp/Fnr family transcriptional regulator [Curvibacter lanceolatus]
MSKLNNTQPKAFATEMIGALSPESRRKLLSISELKRVEAGDMLWDRSQCQQAMVYVESGQIRSYIFSSTEPQFGFTDWGPGNWLGEAFLLLQGDNVFTVEAIESAFLRIVKREDFEQLMAHDAALACDVARLVASRYRRVLCWVEEAMSRPIPERMATKLVRHCTPRSSGGFVYWGSQDNLATCLAVSRPTVNKILKSWERDGLIRISYGSIQITSCEQLLEAAK